jgi:amino acid transporter
LIGFKDVDLANLRWDTIPSFKGIGEASLILFFAFQGSEGGLSVSGEVKDPKRTVPRAIFVSVFGVLILYILLQTVSQGVLGESLATFKDNPLAETASVIFGPIGFTLITIGAAVSMFGALSSEILSMPRVVFAASKKKVIPIKKLSSIHKKFYTPYVAIIVYASLGFLLASVGGFKQLAIISSTCVLLIYFLISLSVIKLRRINGDKESGRAFRIPGGYLVPILSAGSILWFLSNLSLKEFLVLGIFIASLSVIYLIISRVSKE